MVIILNILVLYYVVANAIYTLLIFLSARLIRNRKKIEINHSNFWPEVTVLVAARNEQEVISRCVKSLLSNPYPNLKIIVINDGSDDKTFSVLNKCFHLKYVNSGLFISANHKNLSVIDKENSGKADSLNFALAKVFSQYVVTIDADTFIEKDALFQTVQILEKNPSCKAVGGSIRILNGARTDDFNVVHGHLPQKAISMFQIIEYIRAFFGGRLGWESLGGTALLSGAFTMFRTSALKSIKGFDSRSVTEDFEVIIRMKSHFIELNQSCDFHMIPSPVCWTIVPEAYKSLFWQRVRWQKGLVQTLWRHKKLIFNPRLGRTGLLTLPYMLLFEALSPVVELLGYILISAGLYLDLIAEDSVGIGLGLGLGLYIILTLITIRLEEIHYAHHVTRKSKIRFALFTAIENLGYRQFLFIARLIGNLFAFKTNHTWGQQDRSQIEEKKSA